jgi:hypothetical protein
MSMNGEPRNKPTKNRASLVIEPKNCTSFATLGIRNLNELKRNNEEFHAKNLDPIWRWYPNGIPRAGQELFSTISLATFN